MKRSFSHWHPELFPLSPLLSLLILAWVSIACATNDINLALVPRLDTFSPATAIAGTSNVAITVTGHGFTNHSTVIVANTPVATSFVSATRLRATIPSSLLANPRTLNVSVSNPPPRGGTSPSRIFTVLSIGEVSATNHPQVAKYTFTSPRNATVAIEFGPDTKYGLRTWSRSTPPGGGTVEILVAGIRAFTAYHMRAIVEFPDGASHLDSDHTFTTGGLPPEQIPSVTVSQLGDLSPTLGVQLLDLIGGEPKVRALVTDLEGNVIWFYDQVSASPIPIRFLPNGNFLVVDNVRFINPLREIDLAGNTIREISSPELNQALRARGMEPVAEALHHDAIMLPNGHIMALTLYTKTFTDLVGFEGQAIDVVGDGLVELDENLEPVWVWSSFDHLDVNRHPMGFPDPRTGGFDWTHGNAVVYSPADRNLLLSLRHQHWVIKIDYQDGFGSGEVLWRLGLDGDFTLLSGGPADWQYAQHFPFILDNQIGFFRLALFDNGNNRQLDENGTICGVSGGAGLRAKSYPDPVTNHTRSLKDFSLELDATLATPCFSRAVIFEIDEAMKTARVVWEDKLPFFAPFIGSIQVLENGNVLYDAGTIGGTPNAIVREVTQENPPQTVWQLDLSDQLAYRSLRLPSLYPGVQW